MADFAWLHGRAEELVAAVERGDAARAWQLVAHAKAEGGMAAAEHLMIELCAKVRMVADHNA
ncbi:hypothetical protein [Crossiella sp. NPDC003009]